MTKPIANRPAEARPHVLTGLIAKRREIADQIEDLQRRLKIAVTELDNVESTIRIFEPDIDLSGFGPRPVPPPHSASKGELSCLLIDALKQSGPLNSRQLTEIVMKERSLSPNDLKSRRVMLRRVGVSLNNWKRIKRVLRSYPGPGDTLTSEIDRERIGATQGGSVLVGFSGHQFPASNSHTGFQLGECSLYLVARRIPIEISISSFTVTAARV